MTGTIKKLVADRKFGFIRAETGQEVFFHASAVADGTFASLAVGQAVSFDVEQSEKGPRAANVHPREEHTLA